MEEKQLLELLPQNTSPSPSTNAAQYRQHTVPLTLVYICISWLCSTFKTASENVKWNIEHQLLTAFRKKIFEILKDAFHSSQYASV